MTHPNRRPHRIARLSGLVATMVIGATLALAAGLPVAVGASGGVTVTIYKNFQPSPVEIYAGQSVTWVNRDIVNHFIISDLPGVIPFSGTIAPGKTWRFVFTKVGTWGYHDFNYDAMTGTVIVKPAPAPTPTPKPTATPRPTARPTTRPTAAAVVRATPRPTARPAKATARPKSVATAVASPSASDSSLAGGAVGSLDQGAGPSGGGDAVPADSSGGPNALGLALLLIAGIGLAFVGGFLLAARRREPAMAFAPDAGAGAGAVSLEPTEDVATASASIAGDPPPAESSSGAFAMPYDIDEDAPLENTPPPHDRPD